MDVMREPGLSIGRDISRGEQVEHEISAFIEKRDAARVREEGDRPAEAAWMESERAHNARLREENRLPLVRVPPGAGRSAQSRPGVPHSSPRGGGREVAPTRRGRGGA